VPERGARMKAGEGSLAFLFWTRPKEKEQTVGIVKKQEIHEGLLLLNELNALEISKLWSAFSSYHNAKRKTSPQQSSQLLNLTLSNYSIIS